MLIGLIGAIGSGKDTIAKILDEEHGFYSEKFALPLYEATSIIFAVPAEHLMNDRELKESVVPGFDFTYRKVLQTLGAEWRNLLDTQLWVKLLHSRISDEDDGISEDVVISDVRFQHEIDYIKSKGGFIVKVNRLDNPYMIGTDHISETLDVYSIDVSGVINNDGTLDYLSTLLENLLSELTQIEDARKDATHNVT